MRRGKEEGEFDDVGKEDRGARLRQRQPGRSARRIEENKYRIRSVRLLRTHLGPKLGHLGFLGATLPAVSGLSATVSFPAQDGQLDFGFCSSCDLAYKV